MRKPSLLSSLLRSQEGSALAMVGAAVGVLIASAGIAVDMARVQVVQSRLTNALDAAGLAAGATLGNANVVDVAKKYFYANYPKAPETYLGATINEPVVTGNYNNTILTLTVNGTVPTTFLRYFGKNSFAVSGYTQVTRSSLGMELVLVMDNTGSMTGSAGGSITKLQASKNAANLLLDILYGGEPTQDNLWVGLVPFSQAVNIGTSRSAWTTNTAFNWGPTSWGGCVEARGAGGGDLTDVIPSTAPFTKYYSPCDTASNAWYGTNGGRDNCSTGSGMAYKTPLNANRGPNVDCPQPLTPLVSAKATVVSGVNAMTAQGVTEIPLGMAWAWRLLSPNWRYLWGGEMDINNLPLDYNAPLMHKVVVLMTDGDNFLSHNSYSAYGYPNSGQLGANACSGSNCSNGVNTLNSRTLQLCSSMKANNIIIYTVAFGTSINTTSQNMLRNCATTTDHYFFSPTSAELQTVFQQIGNSLANLRVSQ